MAITGSGTQADPYRPTNWEEFLQCTTADNKYTELPDGGGTFDMEEYYAGGEVHNIPLRGFINGNGWQIKNAKVTNTSGTYSYYGFITSGFGNYGRIENLDFIDFTIDSNGVAANMTNNTNQRVSAALLAPANTNYTGCLLRYSRFLGTLTGNQSFSVSREYVAIVDMTFYSTTIEVCSFNLTLTGDGSITQGTNWQAGLKYCNIRATCSGNNTEFYGCFYYCYIEGDVPKIASYSNVTNFEKTVINANISADSFRIDYGQANMVLVNTDKFDGTLLTGMIGATTNEMKSKTDLDAKGFTISTDPTATTAWHLNPTRNNGFPYIPVMLDIPESAPNGAFENATYLKKVVIPKSCKSIGAKAFAGTLLTSVTIASDCTYSETSFPEGCVVDTYSD